MSPVLILSLLIATLLALLPVWRLHVAGWPSRWLFVAWVMYTLGILVAVRLPYVRFVIPIVVVAFIAPFIAGPERVTRLLQRRPTAPAVIIDVTPRGAQGQPEPPRHVEGEVIDDDPGPER